MDYQHTLRTDKPLIKFTSSYEVREWYVKVFNHAIWGDKEPELYFEDGFSAPIVQYAYTDVERKTGSCPVYARPPHYREVISCKFYNHLRHNNIIAYNGISGVSREGISWLTLCCRPFLSFDPTPFFKGNAYMYPLSENVKRQSVPTRFHLKVNDAGEELKSNTRLAVGRTLVLPSRSAYLALFDAVYKEVSGSVLDGEVLRQFWMVAYLFQPFELVQLALDACCSVNKGKRFVDWVQTAPASELVDVSEFSEEVQNRVERLFSVLYGVDESDTGVRNKHYLTMMVRFVSRMFATRDNENVVSAYVS